MGEVAPVAAGLAVGIAFVVAFSLAVGLGMLPPSGKQEDAYNAAIKITEDLDEVKEFFSVYPNANTTVYFITTCTDEFCSSLWRIPSVVEYWYKDDTGKYADLRIVINYGESKVVSFHTRCRIYDSEEVGIVMHGTSLEGITEFLQDSHCPNN
jgi:hypothetical protein